MDEELTRELPNHRSFEERVFARFDALDARFDATDGRFGARFDAIDARFDAIDARFERVDARFADLEVRLDRMDVRFDGIDRRLDGLDGRVQALEARALDTRPIWERALAEILLVRNGVENLNRKVDVLTLDMMQLRADQRRVEKRMNDLESPVK